MRLYTCCKIVLLLVAVGHGHEEVDIEGVLHVNEAWGLRPGGSFMDVLSARYPEDAPANLLQTWRAVAFPDGAIRINCEEISLPAARSGQCQEYSLTLEDGSDTQVFCGTVTDLSILSKTKDITLTLRTGGRPSGRVNCKVQAREMGPYGEVTEPPTTPKPTTPRPTPPAYLEVESEEIDSSEHGGPPGRVPTTCTCGTANKGDSGGPVVWLDKDTNRYTIVGLPSFVYPFHSNNWQPDVTTDVSSFLPWIHEQLRRTVPEAQACWSTA